MAQKQHTRPVKRYSRVITLLLTLIVLCGVFAVSGSAAQNIQPEENNYIKYAGLKEPIDNIGFYHDINGTPYTYTSYNFPYTTPFETTENGDIYYPSPSTYEETIEREQYTTALEITTPTIKVGFSYTSGSGTITINQPSWLNLGEWYVKMEETDEWLAVDHYHYMISTDEDGKGTLLLTVTTIEGIEGIVYNTLNPSRPLSEFKYLRIEYLPLAERLTSPELYFNYLELRGRLKAPALQIIRTVYQDYSSFELKNMQYYEKYGLSWNAVENLNPTTEGVYKKYNLSINERYFTYDKDGSTHLALNFFGTDKVFNWQDTGNYKHSSIKIADTSLVVSQQITYFVQAKVIEKTFNDNGTITTNFKTITDQWTVSNSNIDFATPLFPQIENRAAFANYFNEKNQYIYIEEYQMFYDVKLATKNVNYSPEKLDFNVVLYYKTTPPQIDNWILGYLGDFTFEQGAPIEIPTSNLVSWLAAAVSGFFNTELLGGITIGSIVWFCLGLGALFAVLKYFAGG